MPAKSPYEEIAELRAQLTALTERKIPVKQLPIKDIQTRLATLPQDPNQSLLPHSIGADLLSEDLTLTNANMQASTADLVANAAYQTVPGLSIRIPEQGDYLLLANLDYELTAGFGYGSIFYGGNEAADMFHSINGRFPLTLMHIQANAQAGAMVEAKAQVTAGGAARIFTVHSRLISIKLGA